MWSQRNLSNSELSVLNKGLNFCPTPGEPDMGQLRRDLDGFHRNLRIKTFFNQSNEIPRGAQTNTTNSKTTISLNPKQMPTNENDDSELDLQLRKSKVLKPKREWSPPMGSLHLESFIFTNERDLSKSFTGAPNFHNLTKEEKKALRDLSKDPNIVTKPADKGGSTVILDREDWQRENDSWPIKGFTINSLPTLQTLTTTKSNISLIPFTRRGPFRNPWHVGYIPWTPRLQSYTYSLKYTKISTHHRAARWSQPTLALLRKSAFTDLFLNPHLPNIRSYIKDTTDFIKKLNDLPRLSENTILCTLDVSSLYTNIPNTDGRVAVGKGPEPSNTDICQMLNMVLTMNNFRFDGEDFLLIAGTAMGTRVAPTYANISMSEFENKFVYTYPKKTIFFIWEHGEEELHKFLEYLNGVHNTIKFTSEFSTFKVNFLDVWVIKGEDGYVNTDLYTKPTDSNNYLYFFSAHPSHCKRGIPLGQFLRLRRILSRDEAFIDYCAEKAKHLLRRRYPKEVILNAFHTAWKTRRSDLLDNVNKKADKKNKNILVTTFNPGFRILGDIVRENWDILGRSCSTRGLFERGVLTVFRRPKNLRDILMRARLPTEKPATLSTGLVVCRISLSSGQLFNELFPDCTRSCFSQVVLRRRGGDRIYEMRCLFVAVGPNARFIELPHWDNMS